MPGLLRGMARTAVVAGTATAVSGRVQRRQAERYAQRDANIYAQREQAYNEAVAPPGQASSYEDTVAQLEQLANLRDQGILTETEFATAKAKLLAN